MKIVVYTTVTLNCLNINVLRVTIFFQDTNYKTCFYDLTLIKKIKKNSIGIYILDKVVYFGVIHCKSVFYFNRNNVSTRYKM